MQIRFGGLVLLLLVSCHPAKKMSNTDKRLVDTIGINAGPPVIIYKTRKDYSHNVPVLLSDDKKTIISYPAPSDIDSSKIPMPTSLYDGFLLDNRGIGPNVAYLNITYKEYAKLNQAPERQKMVEMIVDKDPLTTFCNCGSTYNYKNLKEELDELIKSGKIGSVCKKLK